MVTGRVMVTGEQQYLGLCHRIINKGTDVRNERTGKICRTVINADFTYNASTGKLPLITTRKSYYRQAIAELVGYLRGYTNAEDFANLGCKTWYRNANENSDWLANPNRRGENDLGDSFAYSLGRDWYSPNTGTGVDQFKEIVDKLSRGIDDRRLIMSFLDPGSRGNSCLPACMWTHTFSLLDGRVYLTSMQRSVDVPLGLNFNMIQTVALLRLVARITGHKTGLVFHKMVNCHIYEDQIDKMKIQLTREPYPEPSLSINPNIRTLGDIEGLLVMADFSVSGYKHHDPIDYPFSV